MFSLHGLYIDSTVISQETHIRCSYTHALFKDNKRSTCLYCSRDEDSHVRLVASLGKYAFRKLNAYLFIDCSIENGLAVVYWRSGK